MSTGTPEQFAHQHKVTDEIDQLLQSMIMTYDAKTLSVLLLMRGAQLLRATHSTNLWTVEDARAVVKVALEDVFEPLSKEETPRIATLGMPSTKAN